MNAKPCFFAVLAALVLAGNTATSATYPPPVVQIRTPNPTTPVDREICTPTGDFNITPQKDALLMKVVCPDSRTLRMPRLDGKHPDIFSIPFENAVVSILEREGGEFTLFLHYEVEGDDVHHARTLDPQSGEYTYSFAKFVPDPVKPRPLVKK